MKIERINENQIRCTLSKRDLSDRNLSIKELASGSEKSRTLFREMMQMAGAGGVFRQEGTPIMVEAVPTKGDGIELLLTRMDDLEERTPRFSPGIRTDAHGGFHFFPSPSYDPDDCDAETACFPAAKGDSAPSAANRLPHRPKKPSNVLCFAFDEFRDLVGAAKTLPEKFRRRSNLYKPKRGSAEYLLLLYRRDYSSAEFEQAAGLLAEYGVTVPVTGLSPHYFSEHYRLLIKNTALSDIARL